jgi:hypothetical protein
MQAENEGAKRHPELLNFEAGACAIHSAGARLHFETRAGRDILEAHSPVQAMRGLSGNRKTRIHLPRNSS